MSSTLVTVNVFDAEIMSQPANSLPKKQSSLIHQPFPEHEINVFNPPKRNPNGYLSPARLYLDGILEEQPISSEPENNRVKNILLNPWIISSAIVLLLTNLVFGTFVLVHRQEARKTVEALSAQLELKGPNLAATEFIELNLNTLSNISSPQPEIPTTEPAKSITEAHSGYIPTYAAHPLLSSSKNYYYILTEYAGDRSLELAKAQVQQVSLINFPQGMFIYMGAFKVKSEAEAFIASLEQEGIYAYIYPFD